jgi:PhnB protein
MQLTPYIIFDGNCEEALNFYAKAFGGQIKNLSYYEGTPGESYAKGKNKVMHAGFEGKGIQLMASDSGKGAPVAKDSGMMHLSINFDDVAEEEKVFGDLSGDGKITMPLQDTFWGARFGMLTDKFGVNWMFNCEKKK